MPQRPSPRTALIEADEQLFFVGVIFNQAVRAFHKTFAPRMRIFYTQFRHAYDALRTPRAMNGTRSFMSAAPGRTPATVPKCA